MERVIKFHKGMKKAQAELNDAMEYADRQVRFTGFKQKRISNLDVCGA